MSWTVIKKDKSRMILNGVLIFISLILCVSCGGGGGGGTSSEGGTKLTANAGADLIVDMFTRVDLNPKVLIPNVSSGKLNAQGFELIGSSENKEAIVALTWTKIEGPDLVISSSGFNDGVIYFSVPSTNGASSYRITFKLKITNAAGDSAEDTITITVNRVNQAPIANAGSDLAVEDNDVVSLSGGLSTDIDGSVSKYQWRQLSGQTVEIANPLSMDTSFVAPVVDTESALEFELTVEDNEGKTAKDNVTIVVRQSYAPRVEVYFPTKNAIYSESTLSIFGGVTAQDAVISSVTVDLGSGPLPAEVESDGAWRLDNLAIPQGVAEFTVNVEAIDSLGRKGNVTSRLKTSTKNIVGEGQDWDEVVGISVDSETNKLWVMSYSAGTKPTRLFSIDLSNGNRSPTVSDFSNGAQGVSNRALVQMTFDAQTKSVYVSAAPASDSVLDQILRVDTQTGNRSLVSDSTRGTGPELQLPYGISMAKSGELFLVDNLSSNILSVDVSTGNRKIIADENTSPYAIDAPLYVVADNKPSPERLFFMPNSLENDVLELDLTQNPAVSRLVTVRALGNGYLFGKMVGMAIDNKANKLFLGAGFGELYDLDIATGAVTTVADLKYSVEQMAFDEKRGLLYVIGSLPETLYAVDPVSGKSAIVSKVTDR